MSNVEQRAATLNINGRQVVKSLGAEFAPPPQSQTRQLTASVATRNSDLIEREWQDGCASCTYYRLTPLGTAVRAHLLGDTNNVG